jgi:hypothetical protein
MSIDVANRVAATTQVHRLPSFLAACLMVVSGALIRSAGASDSQAAVRVVHVHYGINKVQLTADGLRGMLVRARRDNGNAHGFDVLSIYALASSKEDPEANLLAVPVWGSDGKERLELTAGGGADCKLHDFRFTVGSEKDLQLITAEREYGSSFVDDGFVTFTYFQLARNENVEIGRPLYYFESVKTAKSAKKYCDVGAAFKQELGIEE